MQHFSAEFDLNISKKKKTINNFNKIERSIEQCLSVNLRLSTLTMLKESTHLHDSEAFLLSQEKVMKGI